MKVKKRNWFHCQFRYSYSYYWNKIGIKERPTDKRKI